MVGFFHLEIFGERRDVGRVRGVIARQIVDQATRERNVREASIRPLEVKLRGPIGCGEKRFFGV